MYRIYRTILETIYIAYLNLRAMVVITSEKIVARFHKPIDAIVDEGFGIHYGYSENLKRFVEIYGGFDHDNHGRS